MSEILTRRTAAAGVALVACLVLVARPLVLGAVTHPAAVLAAVFLAIAVAAMAWPVASPRGATPGRAVAVTAAGAGAFAVGRLVGGPSGAHASVGLVVLNSVAAVSEEALFRRLVYGALAPNGVAWAIAGSAALFALVHLTLYGAWVLPVDVAAGLVFGWQRWAAGTWRAPAITHVLANLLGVL